MKLLDAFLSFPALMLCKSICFVSGHQYEEYECEDCRWSGELCRLCGSNDAREGRNGGQ